MAETTIWVPIVDANQLPELDPRRRVWQVPGFRSFWIPDIPHDIDFRGGDGAPLDLSRAECPVFNTYWRITVDERDVEKIVNRVDEQDVPERDKLMAEMLHECRGGWNVNADRFFNSIPGMGSASSERKRMVKDILIQAVHRGLSPDKAEVIRQQLDLPETAEHGR